MGPLAVGPGRKRGCLFHLAVTVAVLLALVAACVALVSPKVGDQLNPSLPDLSSIHSSAPSTSVDLAGTASGWQSEARARIEAAGIYCEWSHHDEATATCQLSDGPYDDLQIWPGDTPWWANAPSSVPIRGWACYVIAADRSWNADFDGNSPRSAAERIAILEQIEAANAGTTADRACT